MSDGVTKVELIYDGILYEILDEFPYEEIVKIAKDFIDEKGGFEKFSEWGLF